MKSNVAVWALAITMVGVLIGATKVQAEIISPTAKEWIENQKSSLIVEDSEVCGTAVTYAMRYMNSTDPQELHRGAWNILLNKNLDDAQKLITLATYHTIQEIAWRNVGKIESREESDALWTLAKDRTVRECEYALNRIRFPDMI